MSPLGPTFSSASARERNRFPFRHPCRKRPLNASMKVLSVGFPGRPKSSFTSSLTVETCQWRRDYLRKGEPERLFVEAVGPSGVGDQVDQLFPPGVEGSATFLMGPGQVRPRPSGDSTCRCQRRISGAWK